MIWLCKSWPRYFFSDIACIYCKETIYFSHDIFRKFFATLGHKHYCFVHFIYFWIKPKSDVTESLCLWGRNWLVGPCYVHSQKTINRGRWGWGGGWGGGTICLDRCVHGSIMTTISLRTYLHICTHFFMAYHKTGGVYNSVTDVTHNFT